MKLFKKIGIGFLALVICFCSCFKFTKAETQTIYVPLSNPFNLVNGNYYLVVDKYYADDTSDIIIFYDEAELITGYAYNLNQTFNDGDLYIEVVSPTNTYNITLTYEFTYSYNDVPWYVYSFTFDDYNQDFENLYFDDTGSVFITTNDNYNEFSVYDTIYGLIDTYIFGGNIEKGSHQDLTATILSSIICVLVFALPFLIIWKVIKVIMG